ncbi:MAG: hypothetical protein IPJ84_10595 [Bdellovibrionales bacterium]|nr:hypothetical protein [Bdellovibrionales bacterium]
MGARQKSVPILILVSLFFQVGSGVPSIASAEANDAGLSDKAVEATVKQLEANPCASTPPQAKKQEKKLTNAPPIEAVPGGICSGSDIEAGTFDAIAGAIAPIAKSLGDYEKMTDAQQRLIRLLERRQKHDVDGQLRLLRTRLATAQMRKAQQIATEAMRKFIEAPSIEILRDGDIQSWLSTRFAVGHQESNLLEVGQKNPPQPPDIETLLNRSAEEGGLGLSKDKATQLTKAELQILAEFFKPRFKSVVKRDDVLRFSLYTVEIRHAESKMRSLMQYQTLLQTRPDSRERGEQLIKSLHHRYGEWGAEERKKIDCGHDLFEQAALNYYTGEGYRTINSTLRNGSKKVDGADKVEIEDVKSGVVPILNNGLERLRIYKGKVVRGASLPQEEVKKHVVGAVVTYPAYTSSSISNAFGGTHRFIIHSKTGRYVDPFSASRGEREVLFKAGAKFKVLSVSKKGDSTVIVLDEVG